MVQGLEKIRKGEEEREIKRKRNRGKNNMKKSRKTKKMRT